MLEGSGAGGARGGEERSAPLPRPATQRAASPQGAHAGWGVRRWRGEERDPDKRQPLSASPPSFPRLQAGPRGAFPRPASHPTGPEGRRCPTRPGELLSAGGSGHLVLRAGRRGR